MASRGKNGKETREKMGENVWKAIRGRGRGMGEDIYNANVKNTGKTDGQALRPCCCFDIAASKAGDKSVRLSSQ